MASHAELRALFNDSGLRNRVTAATVISAHAEISATPGTLAGRAWALDVLARTEYWGEAVFKLVLAASVGETVANIQGASDAAVLNAVNAVKPNLIAANAGA